MLADLTRYFLLACAALALAELVLLPLRFSMVGIVCGLLSSFLLPWAIGLLAVLVAWGHAVLLAGQGVGITRWLVRVGALLAPFIPVCWLYTLATGELLLYRQAELPIILGVLMLGAALVNIPKMAAASWQLQLRIVLLPVLLLLAYCCEMPGMLVFCAVFKILAAWVAYRPLKQLASLAPRIISMPEKDM